MAIIRRPDGTFYSESFKDYGRFEVEMVLAALIALPEEISEIFAHPLFIAQDPNLYWPLIFDHGCLRAAMAHVAPHIDWLERLGPIIPPPLPSPVVPGITTPGTILRRCGNEACLRVEVDESQSKKKARGETSMMKCGRCSRRVYCSKVNSTPETTPLQYAGISTLRMNTPPNTSIPLIHPLPPSHLFLPPPRSVWLLIGPYTRGSVISTVTAEYRIQRARTTMTTKTIAYHPRQLWKPLKKRDFAMIVTTLWRARLSSSMDCKPIPSGITALVWWKDLPQRREDIPRSSPLPRHRPVEYLSNRVTSTVSMWRFKRNYCHYNPPPRRRRRRRRRRRHVTSS